MATTQFAMVEELASLIKDNLHSKHLILSTEEALIAALQQLRCADDGDSDGGEEDGAADTIELRPAGAYHRLLLHRLAEVYGYCCLLAPSGGGVASITGCCVAADFACLCVGSLMNRLVKARIGTWSSSAALKQPCMLRSMLCKYLPYNDLFLTCCLSYLYLSFCVS